MSRRENLELASLDAEPALDESQLRLSISGSNTVKEILGALPASPGTPRLWTVGLWVQVVLCAALVTGGALLWKQVHALREATATQHAATQGWVAQSAALTDQTRALKLEVNDLRQYLSSSAAEDLLFLKVMVLKPSIDQELARAIARYVHKYAELHGRDPNLVLAIIAVESDFNPNAVSPVGAAGLMQVMPQWRKVLGISEDLRDPETSIRYGLQALGFYIEMYKDTAMALTAYNRGPGPVDSALMHGRDPKNSYPTRVLAAYDRLKRLSVTQTGK